MGGLVVKNATVAYFATGVWNGHFRLKPDEPFVIPLGREFSLHTFSPEEVKSAVEEYLVEAQRLGFRQVRIIHGKGTGHQRAEVKGNRGAAWTTLRA